MLLDPMTWSLPLGRAFGVNVRVHVLFPMVSLALLLQAAFMKDVFPGTWADALLLQIILFFSVLLHEYGHCFGARWVEGDCREILMWPLGGLAYCDVPNTPRANFITTAAGPLVTILLCLVSGLLYLHATDLTLRLPWNPIWYPYRVNESGALLLYKWNGEAVLQTGLIVKILAQCFWLNWILALLNVLIIGYPLDGGQMMQAALWPRLGYRQSMLVAIVCGFVFSIIIVIASWVVRDAMIFALGLFILFECRRRYILLETGGDESGLGYDFTEGYTSLDRDPPTSPRRRRPNFIQRWLQKRAARRLQREQEEREAEERRMDELLDKVNRDGLQALTEEEKRFMKRVSDRYRNRQ